jgi:hypothetical protein
MPNMEDAQSSINGLTAEHAAAIIVLGSLVALIAIKRGFRGIGIPGVAHIKVG